MSNAIPFTSKPPIAEIGSQGSPPPVPDAPSGRKKVLIVDDSVVILRTLSMKLTANGYDVVTAEDGGTAVNIARNVKPDIILLDVSFPPDVAHGGGVPWDGFLIMAWLRRMEEVRDIPVIVITGGDPAKMKSRALAAGAISFFHKPFNNDELLAVIGRVIADNEAQKAELA